MKFVGKCVCYIGSIEMYRTGGEGSGLTNEPKSSNFSNTKLLSGCSHVAHMLLFYRINHTLRIVCDINTG